uniref:cyclin-dependent kinase inhibitor 1-like n=1 Tax=Myxine glutinosa TaxID=7769 RepID=UPI00358E5BC8
MGSQRQPKKGVCRVARPRGSLAQPGEPVVTRPVCRNLFGPVDHEATRADLRAQLREMVERSRCRWNFDFRRDASLEGRYLWEAVSVSVVPECYKPASCGAASTARATRASEPGLVRRKSGRPRKPAFPESSPGSGRRDLTDFFEKRKRAASPFENTAACIRGVDELRPQPIAMH